MFSKKIILCVDDEPMILEVLREQIVHDLGNQYDCLTALNGGDGLEIIKEVMEEGDSAVIIVVSDWLMPGMKGDEFLINVHERYPDIATILVTGQADEAAIKRIRENANLRACLSKPWSAEELITKIRQCLETTP